MATTKKITEAQALAIALTIANGEEDMKTACTEAGFTIDEYAEKLEKMHEMRTKKRAKDPNAKTKERIVNEGLAKEAAKIIAEHGEPVGSKWVMEHVNYITSTQKVTSVMKVANELGLIESTKGEKGRVLYAPIV